MAKLGLTVRDFAKRDGCSSTLVQRGKDDGRLAVFPDGSLDPALVGTDWRESARNADAEIESVHSGKYITEFPESADAEQVMASMIKTAGIFANRKEAEKHRDTFVALMRELEYEQKRGTLIEIDKVSLAIAEDYGRVRTRLLAIPSEQAPALLRCKTAVELRDALMTLMVEVLEELSYGGEVQRVG